MTTKPINQTFRIGPNFKKALEKAAAEKEETVAEYIRKAIEKRMEEEK